MSFQVLGVTLLCRACGRPLVVPTLTPPPSATCPGCTRLRRPVTTHPVDPVGSGSSLPSAGPLAF
jgi:uncharacterized paraquat-inducible protein A